MPGQSPAEVWAQLHSALDQALDLVGDSPDSQMLFEHTFERWEGQATYLRLALSLLHEVIKEMESYARTPF